MPSFTPGRIAGAAIVGKVTEIELKGPHDPELVAAKLESTAGGLGLVATRTSLSKYPGSLHWHFKRPGEKGTLEATWWPKGQRLWLSVHEGRSAPWQDAAVEVFLLEFNA